jgi:hypothetical protein
VNEPLSSIHTNFGAAFQATRQIADGPLTVTVRPKRLADLDVASDIRIGDPDIPTSQLTLSGTPAPGRHPVWIAEATFALEGGEPGSRVACALLGNAAEASTRDCAGSVEVGGVAAFVAKDGAVVTFPSGWGEGVYDAWIGRDPSGAVVAIALDFRALLKPVYTEIALGDVKAEPLGPLPIAELSDLGVDLSVVAADNVPSYLRDGPGHEPERWIRLDCRAADAERFADPRIVGYDRDGNERFVPIGTASDDSYTPLDGEPHDLALRYVSGLRVL